MSIREKYTKRVNMVMYAYRRNRWMLDLHRYFSDFAEIPIDRPIFLLGVQGGGLTLVSRMLRRQPHVVSVTGNHRYWAGADEMQNVLGQILPAPFTGIKHKVPPDDIFGSPRGWSYATDQLLPKYRCTERDATQEFKAAFEKTLRWLIQRHAEDSGDARFVDKSQLYTVKVSFLNALLREHHPKFLLVTRDPYALCLRAAHGRLYDHPQVKGGCSLLQKLRFACEHWTNSMRCALDDGDKVEAFQWMRFEDLLSNPEAELPQICEFLELAFDPDMLPQPHHRLPLGSTRRDRWYPLRPDVNDRYFQSATLEQIEIIDGICGDYARHFGYGRPAVR